MVKRCHMRNNSIKQTLSRRTWPRNNRRCSKLHISFRLQTRTTKQDGDEHSFESTEVSARKATESRNEVQKVSERDTFPEAPAEGTSKKLQTTRSTESEVQRATNEQSRVAEVTKIETPKINHEVVNDTRSKTSESQPRSSTEDTS